jgi:membrane protease YdiL (CAAX protease family)
MSTAPKETKQFFLVTFLLTLPTYILVIVFPDMALSFLPLMVMAPIGSGIIMAYNEDGKEGMMKLARRGFDFKVIKNKTWFIAIFLLLPLIFAIAFGVLALLGPISPEFTTPFYFAPIIFLGFFIMAYLEEVGWMGYAFDKMQASIGVRKTTISLSLIWALWHLPVYLFVFDDLWAILFMQLCLIGARVIMIWIYNNTNQSVFGAICFHAMYNVTLIIIPNFMLAHGTAATCAIIMLVAAVVYFLPLRTSVAGVHIPRQHAGDE